jgi:hypothetical protein
VPTRSEPVRTIERLLSYPEAHAVAPGGRKPTCECMSCNKCARRLWFRLARKGIKLGPWTSQRARNALESRLTGLSWAEVARRHGYRSGHTCRESVLALVGISEREKAQLRGVPAAKRARRIEIVPRLGPATLAVRRMTRSERLVRWRAEVTEEALIAVRADAPKSEIRQFLHLIDQIDARLAAIEDDDGLRTDARRADNAVAKTEVAINGRNRGAGERRWSQGKRPGANGAQRSALNQLTIKSA